jgi:hypothetical protein
MTALLQASFTHQWTALQTSLSKTIQRELVVVIDGFDKVEVHRSDFLREVCTLIEKLRSATPRVKALITSGTLTEIKEYFGGKVPAIVFDEERTGKYGQQIYQCAS